MGKKFASFVVLAAVLLLQTQFALAATYGPTEGAQINGWYKDSFQIRILYGNHGCPVNVQGTAFEYILRSKPSYEGTHIYKFYRDTRDNPYLQLDGGAITQLDFRCPADALQFPELETRIISLDISAPSVGIAAPADGTTTTASNITVSGNTDDSASGVAGIQILINGNPGPMATISGKTFSANVSLPMGPNSIKAVAYDNVGHARESNQITVHRLDNGGGGGPTAPGTPPANSPPVDKDPTQPSGDDSNASDDAGAPNLTEAFTPAIPEKTEHQTLVDDIARPANRWLTLLILVLVVAISILITLAPGRFLPTQGLRPKILVSVILPSLLPILGLGALGYIELTDTVKRSLSSQLAKAAQTTALRLERDFDNRQIVLINTGSEIINISNEYSGKRDTLSRQRTDCSGQVRSNRNFVNHTSCTPFLASFAKTDAFGSTKTMLAAIEDGYKDALAELDEEESGRIKGLLNALRLYFPETMETIVLDASNEPKVLASQAGKDGQALSILPKYKDQYSKALASSLNEVTNPRILVMSHPITSLDGKPKGAVLVAYNLDHVDFIKPAWNSTPKPHDQDLVMIVDQEGQLIYPGVKIPAELTEQFKKLFKADQDNAGTLEVDRKQLISRTSPVTNMHWATVVAAPSELVLKPLVGIQRAAIVAILLSAVLAVSLAYLFVGRITRYIARLVEGARSFAVRRFDHRIKLNSGDELETLANTMNTMASQIESAEKALDEKNKEFINVATHELKAPMTAIIGNLSMLRDGDGGKLATTGREMVEQAYDGTVRLRDLVADLLDIARLEAGKAQFDIQPLDLVTETRAILDMQQVPAKDKKIKVTFDFPKSLPRVAADKTKLQIIMTNFVSNGIKYNREGGDLKVTLQPSDETVTVTVSDTGLGIPQKQQAQMFQKFFRVEGQDRAGIPGTGLGLYITKQFIEAMGGKLWFESVEGHGTSFHFTLPITKPGGVTAPAATAKPQSGHTTPTSVP